MLKAIFFDAGGVLFLNYGGEAIVNQEIVEFLRSDHNRFIYCLLSATDQPLDQIVRAYQLESYFTLIQTTGQTGLEKTAPEFYTKAVAQMGLDPVQVVMIDDNTDFLRAATKAGLKTVHYRPGLDIAEAIAPFR